MATSCPLLLTQILQGALDLQKLSSISELASPGNHSLRTGPMRRCCMVASADCNFSSKSVQNYLCFKVMIPIAGFAFLFTS